MNITRNNYEEFFMLYADNELSAAVKKDVEAFIAANPDLQHELELFQQFKLSPDTTQVYAGKETLMRQDNGSAAISISNYESFFVLYADNELTNNEKAAVEDFVYHHPQLQSAFEIMQQAKINADTSIVFENKESLYRKEEDDKVIPFGWWKLAVAAMVLLIAGALWMYQANKDNNPGGTGITKSTVTNPDHPTLNTKEEKAADNIKLDSNSNEQPVKEEIASTIDKKESQQHKSVQTPGLVAKNKQPVKHNSSNTDNKPDNKIAQDDIAKNTDFNNTITNLKGSNINSIQAEKKVVINTASAAAASKTVIDQQLAYTSTDGSDKEKTEQAVYAANNNVEVLNTSVDTKNSLRGFFRKASRMLSRKTSTGDDDSKPKSLLIGGFEIAVR